MGRGLPNQLQNLSKSNKFKKELSQQVLFFSQRLLLAKKKWDATFKNYLEMLGFKTDNLSSYKVDWKNIEAIANGKNPPNKENLGPNYAKSNKTRQGS